MTPTPTATMYNTETLEIESGRVTKGNQTVCRQKEDRYRDEYIPGKDNSGGSIPQIRSE